MIQLIDDHLGKGFLCRIALRSRSAKKTSEYTRAHLGMTAMLIDWQATQFRGVSF
jgi:hypothetical protein